MPNRRTRNRQLQRLAERRYAERRRRQRRRQLQVVAAALVIALVGLTLAVVAFRGPGPRRRASASVSPSTSPTASPSTTSSHCSHAVPKAAATKKPRFSHAPAMSIDPSKTYTATMRTSCGTIVIRLLADHAPKTVNSFVFLADKGFYDGTRFHRIDTTIDIIQGGDPTATGTGGPGYSLPDELTGKESYGPGTVAMANSGPNTDGSQFFIVFGPSGHKLDANPNYTVFGKIVKGLNVARAIGALPTKSVSDQQPARPVYVDSVRISVGK